MSFKVKINSFLDKFNVELIRNYPRPFERFGLKGTNLVGIEIGVYGGKHSKYLIDCKKVSKLYLIDPYKSYGKEEGTYLNQEHLDKKKEEAIDLLEDLNVEFIYESSEKAKDKIKEEVDFVYIDGGHDYENVKRDLNNYYEKVKLGGVLGGHDIANGNGDSKRLDCNGVVRAVCEFVEIHKLKLYIENRDWWVYKDAALEKKNGGSE